MSPAGGAWVTSRLRLGAPRLLSDLFLTAVLAAVVATAARIAGDGAARVIALVIPLLAAPQAVRGAGLFAAESADGTLAEWLAVPGGIEGVFAAESVAELVRLALRALALVGGLALGRLHWGPSELDLLALTITVAPAAQAASAAAHLRRAGWWMALAGGLVLIAVVVVVDRVAATSVPVPLVRGGLAITMATLAICLWLAMRSALRSDWWRLGTLRS